MRTSQASLVTEPTSTPFPRTATVRVSALATAFLTGTAAISLLVAPAAGAAALQGSVATGTQQTVATTWGHDETRQDSRWDKWTKPSTKPKPSTTPAPTPSVETKTVAWLMPKSTKAEVSWPQELAGTVPDCGTGWYQVDVYRYGTPEEKKFVDEFMADGILAGPSEDGAVYLSHKFVQPKTPVCTPPRPTPSVPVTPPVVEVPEVPAVEVPEAEVPAVEVPEAEVPEAEVPAVEVPEAVEAPAVVPPATVTPVVTAPVVTPPVSGVGGTFGQAPVPTVVPPASNAPAAPKPVVVAEGNQLAVTGAKVGLLSALAAAFVAAGIVAFRISRRPQTTK